MVPARAQTKIQAPRSSAQVSQVGVFVFWGHPLLWGFKGKPKGHPKPWGYQVPERHVTSNRGFCRPSCLFSWSESLGLAAICSKKGVLPEFLDSSHFFGFGQFFCGDQLRPPVVPFYLFWEPYYRKRGTLILTSVLENLDQTVRTCWPIHSGFHLKSPGESCLEWARTLPIRRSIRAEVSLGIVHLAYG